MEFGKIIGVFGLLLTVAVTAVIVSQKAQTASIVQALGAATAASIGAAVAPVTQSNAGSGNG